MSEKPLKYSVIRPPLSPNFYLPPKDELLKIKVGDLAKVMFKVDDETVERIWIIVTKQQDIAEWTGVIDNDPIGEKTAKVLKPGTEVIFHPLDIITTHDENNNEENRKYLERNYKIKLP